MRYRTVGICLVCLAVVASAEQAFPISPARETPEVKAVNRVVPSTVSIFTYNNHREGDRDDLSRSPRKGMGTGIIFDSRGYIVTNAHVVKSFDRIKVILGKGEEYDATPEAILQKVDIAVIKINPKRPLPEAPFGSTCDLQLGERVLAIGNPFGYEMTVTQGIVSCVRRDDVIVDENNAYHNVIQTDTAINPGNSGGPLVNFDGEIIGINVAIRAQAQKIAFTLKIDDVRRELAKAIDVEKYKGLTHGLRTTDVKSCESRHLLVDSVVPNSPADAAGFKQYDVVKRVNGFQIVDRVDLERSLFDVPAGQVCEAVVHRNGDEVKLNLQVAEFHNGPSAMPRQVAQVAAQTDLGWSVLGVKSSSVPVGTLPPKLHYNPESNLGYKGAIRVVAVRPGSPASRAGLTKGDLLVGMKLDNESWRIISSDNIDYIINKARDVKASSLVVYRVVGENQEPVTLQLVMGKSPSRR